MVAAAADQGNRRLGRFHPPSRAVLRHARVARERRPMEHRAVRGAAMLEDGVLLHLQVLVGRVVVVVLHRHLAGGKRFGLAELDHHVRRRADAETQRGIGDGVEAVVFVGHDQRVAVGIVLEEVVPAFFLHQARREVQRRLVELRRRLALGRRGIQAKRGLGHAGFIEDDLEDVLGGLVEEHPAVALNAGMRQLRHEDHLVELVDDAALLEDAEFRDDAVEVSRRLPAVVDRDASRLVEHVGRVDRAGGDRFDFEPEQLADRLGGRHPDRRQRRFG